MTLASKIKIDISKKFELDFVSLFPLISHTTTYSLDWLGRSVFSDNILFDDLLCKAFGDIVLEFSNSMAHISERMCMPRPCWQRK